MRQKQREFEQIMLSGVSNEQREAMWQTAQEKAVSKEINSLLMHACTYLYSNQLASAWYTPCKKINHKVARLCTPVYSYIIIIGSDFCQMA